MKTIDLTTLQGWNNLPNGTYSVTVGAKAAGYTRIKQSSAVSIVKESSQEEYFLTFKSKNGTQFNTYMDVLDFNTESDTAGISWDGTVEYSTDKENWNVWDGTSVSSSVNGEIYFRGIGNTHLGGDLENYDCHLVIDIVDDTIAVNGNIENLLDYATVELGNHPAMADACFSGLFSNCTSLVSAPSLPATILADYCYSDMFSSCINLTTAPVLPATILAEGCYVSMFYGCEELTTAPSLPATTLAIACYSGMFAECTSLTTAPALPATTLVDSCYVLMFEDCTSLTTAPELPATILAGGCYYQIFRGCTSLYVSDTQTAEAQYEWRIPANGVITGTTYSQDGMFVNCLGVRASDDLDGEVGQQYIYYTQNPPVGSN